MERQEIWWRAGGPASLLARIVRAVGRGERVVCVEAPDPRPRGFADALDGELRRELSLSCRRLDFSDASQRESLPHLIAERLDVAAAEIASVDDFADHRDLADTVVVVDGVDRQELRRWGLFLRALNAKSGGPILGPVLIVWIPIGLTKAARKELCGRANAISTMGSISRYDTIAYLSQLGMRAYPDLRARVGQAVMIDVAAWSRDLLDDMLSWEVDDQIAPFVSLEKLGELNALRYPSFENGLVDLWDDEPTAHAAAAMRHGLKNHVRRRVWAAQAGVLLPFTYRILQSFVHRYRDTLDRNVSPQNPYVKDYNGRQVTVTDPRKLEFYDVSTFIGRLMPAREKELLKITRWARHETAHRNVISPDDIETLSDHYEANRDVLEGDIPGWDWPRCGQELTLTIGPPAAGKSRWASRLGIAVVSSDEIRKELGGEMVFNADQATVFREVRDRARKHLAQGDCVVVDAMNLESAHRARQISIMPRDLPIRYAVIGRPLEDKQRDAKWRAEKGLVEKYHGPFRECLEMALGADGLDGIEVIDLRNGSETKDPSLNDVDSSLSAISPKTKTAVPQ